MYCQEYIRKLSVRGSVSMSVREQVLMKIIANLRRLGIDISNSKFKDKDIENEVVMTVYIKDVREYMACYDFIRLEQTLNNTQWSAAFTSITRLEQNAKELGINSFLKPFEGIRAAVIQKNIRSSLAKPCSCQQQEIADIKSFRIAHMTIIFT